VSEQTAMIKPEEKLRSIMRGDEVMSRFREVLGELQASAYTSSVLLVVADTPQLQECTAPSIISSALKAATLKLSCDKNVGHAYLVPYAGKATLIVGYKGLMQMALRTGKYRYINVGAVYEGEELIHNRISGFYEIGGGKKSDTVIGYLGAFELKDGYAKAIYMSVEEIHANASKRPGYNRADGFWKKYTVEMEKKTVLRQLLTKWGYLDPHDVMTMTSEDEQGVIDVEATDAPAQEPLTPEQRQERAEAIQSELYGDPPPSKPYTREDAARDAQAPQSQVIDGEAKDPEPEKPWTNTKVSLAMAKAELNSEKKPYWEMDTEPLTYRFNGIQGKLAKNNLTPEQREELILKRDIVQAIIDYRAQPDPEAY
jgi:recombination protein RecT